MPDAELEALRAEHDVLGAERREDGDLIASVNLLTGFRLTRRSRTSPPGTYDECWDYPPDQYAGGVPEALMHLAHGWEHLRRGEEPVRWYRHRPGDQRRPNGDPERETVRP